MIISWPNRCAFTDEAPGGILDDDRQLRARLSAGRHAEPGHLALVKGFDTPSNYGRPIRRRQPTLSLFKLAGF